ncbi:MAG TPA: substrate-binding domain-containing protein, partial [Longimicrobiales bacterium]|nr:substrate-binding domain-containing protein [Longimicrobiales bacterium]
MLEPGRAVRWAATAGALLVGVLAGCGPTGGRGAAPVTVGATTTLEDSGVLEALLGAYHAAHPEAPTRALTGGTGEILALGRRGDVDLVITHDPVAESLYVARGHGVRRRPLMESELMVAGPAADPAGVAGAPDATAAFARIAAARVPFVSRADDSGTHRKERLIWSRVLGGGAGTRLEGDARPGTDRPAADASWYAQAGVGMGDALRVAGARAAYILT